MSSMSSNIIELRRIIEDDDIASLILFFVFQLPPWTNTNCSHWHWYLAGIRLCKWLQNPSLSVHVYVQKRGSVQASHTTSLTRTHNADFIAIPVKQPWNQENKDTWRSMGCFIGIIWRKHLKNHQIFPVSDLGLWLMNNTIKRLIELPKLPNSRTFHIFMSLKCPLRNYPLHCGSVEQCAEIEFY